MVLKMVKLLSIIILFLVILSVRVYAISMGTLVKNDFSNTTTDSSAKFTILFWNDENESYKLELSVREKPEDWIVIVNPDSFVLNSSLGKELIKLPYKDNYAKANPVDIIVKPPLSTKPGKYNISIEAKAIPPQNNISFSQGRIFRLVVEVINPLYFESSNEKTTNLPKSYQYQNQTQGNFLNKSTFSNFYLAVIFVIVIISFLIYKYS